MGPDIVVAIPLKTATIEEIPQSPSSNASMNTSPSCPKQHSSDNSYEIPSSDAETPPDQPTPTSSSPASTTSINPFAHRLQRPTPPPHPRLRKTPTTIPDSPTPSPPLSDSGNDSLTPLSRSPTPPSPLRITFAHLDREIECRCGAWTWCMCPKHAAFPDPSPAHLSEWALRQMDGPVVGERSTLGLGGGR